MENLIIQYDDFNLTPSSKGYGAFCGNPVWRCDITALVNNQNGFKKLLKTGHILRKYFSCNIEDVGLFPVKYPCLIGIWSHFEISDVEIVFNYEQLAIDSFLKLVKG